MKKKIVAVVLCVVVALCATMMFGCGSMYDGNYVQADNSQITAVSQSASSVAPVDSETGFNTNGISIKMEIKVSNGAQTAKMSYDYKMVYLADGSVQMSGKYDVAGFGEEFWYKDGTVYFKFYGMCFQEQALLEDVLDEYTAENDYAQYDCFVAFAEQAANFGIEGYNFLIDQTEENTKIKIELNNSTVAGAVANGSVVYVFDADYNLAGFRSVLNVNDMIELSITYEPYAGDIQFPAGCENWDGGY